MNDLIRREDAIRTVCEYDCHSGDNPCEEGKGCLAVRGLRKLLSADRPQGEWIELFKPITVKQEYIWKTKLIHDGWSCSECSEVVEKRYPNCPYCLTKMKGVDDEIFCRRNAKLL